MQYLGGKSAQAKSIALILEQHRKGRIFLEPFCGACNVTVAMSGERIASDLHEELIAMWQALQNGWLPPTSITEEQYYDIKHNSTDKALRAFVGFGCSFSGKLWGGLARGDGRNYAQENANDVLSKAQHLHGVTFKHCSYLDYTPNNMLIYCDPPYSNTSGYSVGDFDSALFWQTMVKWAQNNTVFVSEYSIPDDIMPYVTLAKNFKRRHGLRSANGQALIKNELLVQVHATPQNKPIVIEEQLTMF